jgi:ABC-type transport system substrate-binding protein
VFERDQWQPGVKAVFTRFKGYKPRSEPPSWAAGGKVAKVDRVEWDWILDAQTAVNALINGEIELIEAPPHDLLPVLEGNDDIVTFDYNPLGNQYMFRMNSLQKVVQHVREQFTCWRCEAISQAPAPFHPTPRCWAGPRVTEKSPRAAPRCTRQRAG